MAPFDLTLFEKIASRELASAFCAFLTQMQLLHRGEGIVLQATGQRGDVILKVSQVSETGLRRLEGRLAWVDYLHRHGLCVPELRASKRCHARASQC